MKKTKYGMPTLIELDPMLNLALKNKATCVIETKTKEALINSVNKLKK